MLDVVQQELIQKPVPKAHTYFLLRCPLLVASSALIKFEKVDLFFHFDNGGSSFSSSVCSIEVTHHLEIGALGNTALSNSDFMLCKHHQARLACTRCQLRHHRNIISQGPPSQVHPTGGSVTPGSRGSDMVDL